MWLHGSSLCVATSSKQTGHSGLERLRRGHAPSRSASFSPSRSRFYLRSLSFFAASLGAAFAPSNLVVSPLRPIVVMVCSSRLLLCLDSTAAHIDLQYICTDLQCSKWAHLFRYFTLGWLYRHNIDSVYKLPPTTPGPLLAFPVPLHSFRKMALGSVSRVGANEERCCLDGVFAGGQALPAAAMYAGMGLVVGALRSAEHSSRAPGAPWGGAVGPPSLCVGRSSR